MCYSHYFVHGGWFPKANYILDNVDKIRHIPATIIQGRYDVVAPMKRAWDLHKVMHFPYSPSFSSEYISYYWTIQLSAFQHFMRKAEYRCIKNNQLERCCDGTFL